MAAGNVYGDMWGRIVQGQSPVPITPRTPYSRNTPKGRGSGNSPVSQKGLVPVSVRDITPGTTSGLQTVLDYGKGAAADFASKAKAYDYATRANEYAAALKRNKDGTSAGGGPVAPAGTSPFSSTGINIVDPQQPIAPVEAVAPPDPIKDAYDALFGQIGSVRTRNTGDLDAATAAINAAYDAASKGNRDLFTKDANAIDEMAKALGTNFATSKQGIDIDQAARQRQEISDLRRASELAAVEKLRGLQGGVYDVAESSARSAQARAVSDMAMQKLAGQQAMEQLMAEIAAGASGGGGRGRGGGRKKSSSGDTTLTEGATDTGFMNNIGDYAAMLGLDPESRAQFSRFYNLGGLEPKSAVIEAQKAYDKLSGAGSGFTPTMYTNPFTGKKTNLTGGLAKKTSTQAKAGLPSIKKAMDALISFSGALGTVNRDTKVTTSSSKKTK